mgnify:CR=1 FL=1
MLLPSQSYSTVGRSDQPGAKRHTRPPPAYTRSSVRVSSDIRLIDEQGREVAQGEAGEVVVGDINAAMLGVGRDRLTDRGLVRGLEYVQLNAEALPFPDASFDLVTIAFGLRNVTEKANALREMHRVLKVGGRALVLEFSQVKPEWFRPVYDFHSFKVLPRLGKLFANDADSYQYLAESIRKHPPQDELKAMMEAAGFGRCDYRNLSAGICAIHSGYKV